MGIFNITELEILKSLSVWGCTLTLGIFGACTILSRRVKKAWCNPLLFASLSIILFLKLAQVPYAEYKISAAPINYLLFPATVSLAVPLYEKWQLLRNNFFAILAGILSGVLTSLICALLLSLTLGLNHVQYVSLLTKSVTTAIGMDIANELGGIAALTGAFIILTGISGNLIAESVCKLFNIHDKVAKGVGIGTAAHAIGTARALEMGETEGAMSGLSIAVAGILTAIIAPWFA